MIQWCRTSSTYSPTSAGAAASDRDADRHQRVSAPARLLGGPRRGCGSGAGALAAAPTRDARALGPTQAFHADCRQDRPWRQRQPLRQYAVDSLVERRAAGRRHAHRHRGGFQQLVETTAGGRSPTSQRGRQSPFGTGGRRLLSADVPAHGGQRRGEWRTRCHAGQGGGLPAAGADAARDDFGSAFSAIDATVHGWHGADDRAGDPGAHHGHESISA